MNYCFKLLYLMIAQHIYTCIIRCLCNFFIVGILNINSKTISCKEFVLPACPMLCRNCSDLVVSAFLVGLLLVLRIHLLGAQQIVTNSYHLIIFL